MAGDTKYQNLPEHLKCENCNTTTEAPKHCGHPMHLEKLEGNTYWICWMGAKCGKKEFQSCCSNHTLPLQAPLGY